MASPDVDKLFTPDAGLDLDGQTARFTNARFEIDPSYRDTVMLLKIDVIPQGGEETTKFWTCGDATKWEVDDDGNLIDADGKGTNIHKQTNAWGLVASMLEIEALQEVLRERVESGAAPFGPRSPGFYNDLVVELGQEEREVTIDGEKRNSTRTFLTGFTKVYGGDDAKKTTAKKAPAKKAKAKPAAKEEAKEEVGLTTAATKKLDALADDCETHEEFVTRAYAEHSELMQFEDVGAAVEDDSEDTDDVDSIEDGQTTIWGRAMERAKNA